MFTTCQKDPEVASDKRLLNHEGKNTEPQKDRKHGPEDVQTKIEKTGGPLALLDQPDQIHPKGGKGRETSTQANDPECLEGIRGRGILCKLNQKTNQESPQHVYHQGRPWKKGFHHQADRRPQDGTARPSRGYQKKKIKAHFRAAQTSLTNRDDHSSTFSSSVSS